LLDAGAGAGLPGYTFWAQTTHRGSAIKRIPYTERAYERLLNDVIGLFIIAAAREEGDVRVQEGDRILFNLPARPYLSGHVAQALVEDLGFFQGVRDLSALDSEDFSERAMRDFDSALSTGFDHLTALASVLDRVAERM